MNYNDTKFLIEAYKKIIEQNDNIDDLLDAVDVEIGQTQSGIKLDDVVGGKWTINKNGLIDVVFYCSF